MVGAFSFLLLLSALLLPHEASSAGGAVIMSAEEVLESTDVLQRHLDDMLLTTDEKLLDIATVKKLLQIQDKIEAVGRRIRAHQAGSGSDASSGAGAAYTPTNVPSSTSDGEDDAASIADVCPDRGEYPVLAKGLQVGNLTVLHDSPRVFKYEGFASDEEIAVIFEHIEKWKGQSKHDETGYSFEQPINADPVMEGLAKRTLQLLNYEDAPDAITGSSTFRIRHYDGSLNEYHPEHTDWFEAGSRTLIASAMLILTTPEEGGLTQFIKTHPRLEIKPEKGNLLVWFSCTPDAKEDKMSTHQSSPTVSGHKWTATNFIWTRKAWCCRNPTGN
eukprot:g4865.t1